MQPLDGRELPSAPGHPVLYTDLPDRPQPRLDVNNGNGMSTTVGRLRPCTLLDWKFVLLSHNTIRGAAGAAVLNAEVLARLGKLPKEARMSLARDQIVLMKFGGTSVQDAAAIARTAAIVEGRVAKGLRPFVVVSAMAKVTDSLLAAADAAGRGERAGALAISARLRTRHAETAATLLGRRQGGTILNGPARRVRRAGRPAARHCRRG